MVKVSIASTRWGLFSDTCFLLKGWNVSDLRADYCFFIHISIELKIKSAKCVLNRFTCFEAWMKENFLSYLVIFIFCCQSPPLLNFMRLGRSSGMATIAHLDPSHPWHSRKICTVVCADMPWGKHQMPSQCTCIMNMALLQVLQGNYPVASMH